MKHQQIQLASKRNFIRLAAVVAMLALMVCCTVLWVNAAPVAESVTFAADSGIKLENGYWVKTYDGSDVIDASKITINGKSDIVDSAKFNSPNVGEATFITIEYTEDGVKGSIELPAKINPMQLTWSADGKVEVVYDPNGNGIYEGKTVDITGLELKGKVGTDEVTFVEPTVSFILNGYANTVAYADVVLEGTDAGNYTVAPLKVDVNVKPIEITEIEWTGVSNALAYGNSALLDIKAVGNDGIALVVKIQIGNETIELAKAYADGLIVPGSYTLVAEAPNALYNITAGATKPITINKVVYNVVLNDREFLDNGDLLKPENAGFTYQLVVEGKDGAFIPQSVLSQITYKYYDAQGNEVAKVTKPGVYTVKATMPSIDNVAFDNATLEAKMTVVRNYLFVPTADGKNVIMIVGQNGISNSATGTLTLVESFARPAIRGLRAYEGYTLKLDGVTGEVTVYIPVSADILSAKNCAALTANNLYIYNSADGTKEAASAKYTVSLSADGSYYIIEGYAPAGEITFMVAPDFDPTFFASPIGIALLIILALILVIVIPMLIGMKLIQIERSGRNPVISVETDGNVPEVEPVVIPDKIEDPDAVLTEGVDALADAIAAETAAATDDADVDASDAVADAMAELNAELAEIDLSADLVDAENAATQMADELVRGLMDDVDAEAENAADVSDDVAGAVADAMAENFNESADATDAIALVDEEIDELTVESFRDVVDAIVAEAMTNLVDLPTAEVAEEVTEEVVEEATTEEAAPEVAEVAEEAIEEVAEEAVEEVADEAVEEVAEEAEAVEEPAAEEEEIAVCAIVADSVAEAFDALAADGMVPVTKEGTTRDTIVDAVNNAAATYAPESWADEMTDEVKAAVVEELAARLLVVVEEPVVEAEDSDEEDDDSFGGFGSMPLDYIDAIAEAERYAEMLEQERRGEVQLVTRYRRSYLSRLAQSQGSIQDYYNEIKNLLLSYKGVKSRISWNFESFNVGRTPLAKFNAKTRTLYIYIALSPEELVDSKYNFTDMSAKKKYAAVPVLLKVKGDRKFKHAIELLTMLCEEKLQLPKKKVIEEIDYRMPFKTTEELVQDGIIKMMVAAIPVETPAAVEEAPVEESVVEEAVVEEAVADDQNA